MVMAASSLASLWDQAQEKVDLCKSATLEYARNVYDLSAAHKCIYI